MKAETLISILLKVGWIEVRRQDGHRIFRHPDRADFISMPDWKQQVLPSGIVNNIFKEAQLRHRVYRISISHPLAFLGKLLTTIGIIKKR